MYVINQPWDGRGNAIGDYIIRLLTQDEPRFEIFRACVAFVKAGGMLRLAPALQSFMDRGNRIEIVSGIDDGITSKQGLELVMRYSTTAYVFNNPMTTFHPKLYLFEVPQKRAVAFIGSSNLTSGGLYTNYEANLRIEFDLSLAEDRKAYDSILAIFLNASDVNTGNAIQLDAALLERLVRENKLADETRQVRRRLAPRRARVSEPPLFPRTPVPPAPRIAPNLIGLIPKVRMTGDADVDQKTMTEFQPWEMFVMILGVRDTRQRKGYSRDVYIPLAARDFKREFWGWPVKFKPGSDKTVGRYPERRIDILVRPVTGRAQVVEGVRLYYYNIKHEFRLNCGRLIEGAKPGDLLVIQKSPAGTLFEGHTYEFEATVIPLADSRYQTFVKECRRKAAGRSSKWWGYM